MAAHCRSVSDEEKTMIRAIMNGCHGVMGHVITDIISKDDAIEIVAGVDMNTETYAGYPVFKSLAECPEADVIIDFSTAKAVDGLLDYCEEKKVPVVLCTTGLSEEQLNHVKEASKVDAVLRSANMSIGINLLMKTLKEVAPVLAMAQDLISRSWRSTTTVRSTRRAEQPSLLQTLSMRVLTMPTTINMTVPPSVLQEIRRRSGSRLCAAVPSSASMISCSPGRDEVITFTHTAYSREIFAKGAVEAAKFLAGKPAGLYDMSDVIG